jgi:hypothetical protein
VSCEGRDKCEPRARENQCEDETHLVIVVEVHQRKDLVHSLGGFLGTRVSQRSITPAGSVGHLLGRVFIRRKLHHLARHSINTLDDSEHLIVGNQTVLVYVVELEGP